MVDRRYRPIAPVDHADEREHRRLIADRANAGLPKDGTEGMSAPMKAWSVTAASLTGDYAASLWEGAVVYVSDEDAFAYSDGTTWQRFELKNLGLADPNADRIVFWDDSVGDLAYLTPGTNLSITGTSIDVTSPLPVANGGTGQTTEAEALGEMIQALSEDTSPDQDADYGVTYDASGDTGAKVLFSRYGSKVNMGNTATTSGTSFDFTSIPSGVRRITICLDGVSLSGTDNYLIQIGDSGGIETSAYSSSSGSYFNTSVNVATSTSGFLVICGNAASTYFGVITLLNTTGNTWVQSHSIGDVGGTAVVCGGGSKSTSATLDRVRLTRSGTNTFDAGSLTVFYEF